MARASRAAGRVIWSPDLCRGQPHSNHPGKFRKARVVQTFLISAFALVFLVSSDGACAVDGSGCAPDFVAAGRAAAVGHAARPYVPFAALKREIPWLDNPETFPARFAAREAQWRAANPGDPNNVPMPENKPAIDWLKSLLQGLDKHPHYRYRDLTTRVLTRKPRQEREAELLRRLADIERRGYPKQDTLALVIDAGKHLDRIAPIPLSTMDLIDWLPSNVFGPRRPFEVLQPNMGRLSNLHDAVTKSVGPTRLAAIKTYETELLAVLGTALRAAGSTQNPRELLRRYEYQYGLPSTAEYTLLDLKNAGGLFHPALLSRKPILLVPGELSPRGLAELVLFGNEQAGLIGEPMAVDGLVRSLRGFLNHDFDHIGQTLTDPVAKALVAWPAAKKHALLAGIDALPATRQRQLAEYGLLMGMRESLGRILVEPNLDTRLALLGVRYTTTAAHPITPEETRWLLQWINDHLPLQP